MILLYFPKNLGQQPLVLPCSPSIAQLPRPRPISHPSFPQEHLIHQTIDIYNLMQIYDPDHNQNSILGHFYSFCS